MYIDKLEECLEDASCVGPMFTSIIITLLLYVVNIVLLVKSSDNLSKQLGILQDVFSKMGMTINTYNTKFMIIKSKNISYGSFIYDNSYLEEDPSYLGINIDHQLNWNYSIEKRISGGWKAYYGLESNWQSTNLDLG